MLVRPNVDFCFTALNFTYHPAGGRKSMQLGNGRWESTTFNSRLQPTQIALGVTQGATNLLDLDYEYGATASVNNGNVTKQTISVPTVGQSTGFVAVQTYSYDSLNRLKDATENITPNGGSQTQSWKQTFTFDRYGNRRFDFSNNNTTMPDANCTQAVCNPTISTTNNRLTSAGWSYDSSGNTTADPEGRTFVYDAENKQVEVKTGSTIHGQYWYDGDGKRVKKKTYDSSGNLTEDTIFVYDATGRSIAEYSAIDPNQGEGGSAPAVAYLTNDHLGSPRVNTNASGAVTSRHDYHPFGEEIVTSQRTAHPDYAGDTVRKQFTGYEYDAETSLQYSGARQLRAGLGRFSIPDDFLNDTVAPEPSSWNLYVDVRNNPMNLIDPDGEKVYVGGLDAKDRQQLLDRMNYTYGCNGCVSVDSDGYLTVDTSHLSQDMIRATAWLTDAIRTTTWFAEVQVSNGTDRVAFGEGREGKGLTPCLGGRNCMIHADLIVLDFSDDNFVIGDKDAKEAFLNTVLAHEIAHFRIRPGIVTPDPTDPYETGLVVDAINEILSVRGAPLRESYLTSKFGDLLLKVQSGKAEQKNGQTVRNVDGGIKVTATKKIVSWWKKNVGGKGIN